MTQKRKITKPRAISSNIRDRNKLKRNCRKKKIEKSRVSKISILRRNNILCLKVTVSFSRGDWLYIYDGNQTSGSKKLWVLNSENHKNKVYLFPTTENLLMQFQISEKSSITASITDNVPRTYHKYFV